MAAPSPPSPSSSAKTGEPRYLILLLVTVLGTLVGGIATAFTVGALLSFLPVVVAVLIGAVLGFGLPIFLAMRAGAALKRRKYALVVRRVAALALIFATQLAMTGAILQYSSRQTGHVVYTAWQLLGLFGSVPVVSDLLYSYAERDGALPVDAIKNGKNPKKPTTKVGPDGGVLLRPDGGPAPAPLDGGPRAAPAAGVDGGVAKAAVDAGVAVAPAAVHTGPAAPKPKPGIGLSARVDGKPARTFAAGLSTASGDSLVLVGTVGSGGVFTSRIVDLSAQQKLGEPTILDVAEDGTLAAILGGAHLVVARPGKTTAETVRSLEPGQRLAGLEIQAVRDVVVGPGGAGLAVVDELNGGELASSLVALPQGKSGPAVLRKAGDKVPGSATDATVAKSWTFKKGSGLGSVLVAETYLEGGDDLGTKMTGENYVLNPERLLVVKLDQPKAQVEVARTGTEPSGIDGKEIQIFGDAALLPDGRAVFDANFIENGGQGWLFQVKPGNSALFAIAPELGDKAAWSSTAPRVQHLDVGSDGTIAFRRDDGAVALTSLDKPSGVSAALLGADAVGHDGHRLGTITNVDVPLLARGGEWLIASVQENSHDAIVLASKLDIQNGKAEVLLEVGAPVPEKTTKPRTIQALRFGKGRDELLWQR
ncbi:MAG TPA: hypothetical protein VGO62_08625 [Myxococcota bacterium]|jgi:hypothetical protein